MISYEEYYAYGSTAYSASASGVDLSLKRYRFTGKERDEETGLDYFGVRYYASWLGRWTSSDPGGFVDGLNLYRYVKNNPVNGIDAEGYSTESVVDPKEKEKKKEEIETIESNDPLGEAGDEIVVIADRDGGNSPSGIVYGNEQARKDVLSRTSKTTILTEEKWESATKRERKKWVKKGIGIGSEIINKQYNKEFAKYIEHLDSLEEVFVLSYIESGDETVIDENGNKHGGGFYATTEVGKFTINYRKQGKEYGGTRFHVLFEEIHHAYSFTQGNFKVSTADEKGGFSIGNYDVYDELDAKIFSLEAGSFSKYYRRKSERNGQVMILNIPTELGLLASAESSMEYKVKYLIEGIEEKVSGTLGGQQITANVPLGGKYKTYIIGKENRSQRLYNDEKVKIMSKDKQAFPHNR